MGHYVAGIATDNVGPEYLDILNPIVRMLTKLRMRLYLILNQLDLYQVER